MVPRDKAPKSFEDLLDPQWKDKLGMDTTDYGLDPSRAAKMSGMPGKIFVARGLVQPVLRREVQRIPLALRQRRDEQRRAADVEHGVFLRELARQQLAALARRHLEVRHEQHDLQPRRQRRGHVPVRVAVADDDAQAAEQRRRHVVGVALQPRAQRQHLRVAQRAAHQRVRADDARRPRRRARAEPAADRDASARRKRAAPAPRRAPAGTPTAPRRAPAARARRSSPADGRARASRPASDASASPRLSKPGPRLALVAGTRTVTKSAWREGSVRRAQALAANQERV